MEMRSHPVWVRGLKHFIVIYALLLKKSHPVWVRGLKLVILYVCIYQVYTVAPCMGAWIETFWARSVYSKTHVAPCMGAWIETCRLSILKRRMPSRTLYGCVD